MEVIVENTTGVTKMCRACLSRDEPFLEIFDANYSSLDEKLTLCEMFIALGYIKVQLGDGLPDVICPSCADKVNEAHNFKTLCKRSDAFLRDSMASGQLLKIEGYSQDSIHLVKAEIVNIEETDCLETSLSLKAGVDILPNNASTSTEPMLIHSNNLTQDLNLMDTVQSTCEDVIVKIKKETTSDLGNESKMSKPTKNATSKKNTTYKNNPSIESKTEEIDNDLTENVHFSLPSVEPKIFTCVICSQAFTRRSDLISHKKTHPVTMKHQCPHCEKHYSNIYTLKKHIITHSNHRPHLCTICGRRFYLLGNLTQHLKYHRGIKPHTCLLCEKCFYTPYRLKEHMRYSHSDNRYNATCNVCGKKFTTKNALQKHMKIHAGKSVHVCKLCGKGFSLLNRFKQHLVRHTNQPFEFIGVKSLPCQSENCEETPTPEATSQMHFEHKSSMEHMKLHQACPEKDVMLDNSLTSTKSTSTVCSTLNKDLNKNQSANQEVIMKEVKKSSSSDTDLNLIKCKKPEPSNESEAEEMSNDLNEGYFQPHSVEKKQIIFTCVICSLTFIKRSELIAHKKTHPDDMRNRCPHCSKHFSRSNTLQRHISTHSDYKPHLCPICGKGFRTSSVLDQHIRYHQGIKLHACQVCDKHFYTPYMMKEHMRYSHSDNRYNATCNVCGKKFTAKCTLIKHMKIHTGERPHVCKECGKGFTRPTILRKHLLRHTNQPPEEQVVCVYNNCGKKFSSKASLQIHIKRTHTTIEDGLFDNNFTSIKPTNTPSNTLTQDVKIHTNKSSHVCEVCGKSFVRASSLRNHMRRHTNQPPTKQYMCEFKDCGRMLSSKGSLQVHIKHKHSTERPFACEFCTKAFATKAGLNEHQSVHTGEKPEVCLLCDNKFVNKQSLKKHMRLHTGERPYPCPHCEQTFICSSRVTAHVQRIHMERSQECPECGKKFHFKRALAKHMRIHRGEKRPKRKQVSSHLTVEVKQIVPEPALEVII